MRAGSAVCSCLVSAAGLGTLLHCSLLHSPGTSRHFAHPGDSAPKQNFKAADVEYVAGRDRWAQGGRLDVDALQQGWM